jgi:hypothetical protein
MVFIVDEGSEFGAPLEKVWKLSEAHAKDAAKIHPSGKNYKTESVSENAAIQSWESDMKGQTVKTEIKVTRFYRITGRSNRRLVLQLLYSKRKQNGGNSSRRIYILNDARRKSAETSSYVFPRTGL